MKAYNIITEKQYLGLYKSTKRNMGLPTQNKNKSLGLRKNSKKSNAKNKGECFI